MIAPDTDVAILGGGLAGTLAAVVLGRAGHRVTLIDRHAVHPADFRAEHLDEAQRALLAEMGLLDGLVASVPLVDRVVCCRRGRLLDGGPTTNYAMPYQAMVNAARRMLPPAVNLLIGRIADLDPGPDRQRITLADGRQVTARLAVLATGFGQASARRLGIERQSLRPGDTMTLGFDLALSAPPRHPFLVYYGEPTERVDYLAVFRMGDAVRANLFTFNAYRDPWTRRFVTDPDAELRRIMPNLDRLLAPYRVAGPVQVRMATVEGAVNPAQDGVVLIGDAFQTSCPAAGTGITRLLSDVDRLCRVHIPAWLATSGMPAAKIAHYYADPVKQARDAECLHKARYRHQVATETGWWWDLHRWQVFARRRLRARLHRPPQPRDPAGLHPTPALS
jgi:2-polyprenyl-6-methoxyphenol hydroxylase-like FAD-dependent oxidoreductase